MGLFGGKWDLGRIGAAIITGGQSELVREGQNLIKDAMTPDIPVPQVAPPPPPPPSPTDPEVAADLTAAQDAERRARGRASTMLTGGLGVSDGDLKLSKRTLLGS